MFDTGFPKDWSTLKKLIWLKATVLKAAGYLKTVTAAIVSVTDALAKPAVDLSVAIEPVQSGTGDPSPDNVRPISGWSAVTLWRTGKNLLKALYAGRTDKDVTYTVDADGIISLSGIASASSYAAPNLSGDKSKMQFFKAGKYTLSGGISSSVRLYFGGIYVDGGSFSGIGYDTGSGLTYTFPKDFWAYPQIVVASGTNTDGITIKPMLVPGSTASDYATYTGETVTVTFPAETGTVYGGTLDVKAGKMTVDRAIATIDQNSTLGNNGVQGYGGIQVVYTPSHAKKLAPAPSTQNDGLMSNLFDASSPYIDYACEITGRSTNGNVYLNMPTGITTVDDAKTWFGSNPTQVLYLLATPFEITLTPTEIQLLAGNNNLWADTGNTTLTYYGTEAPTP